MTLGNEIRSIADRIKHETEVQIKATSRILGAAAQISENHERLINEVVEMLEEDIDQQNKISKNSIYSVDALKQQFKTFNKAKSYFNLKVKSWEALANKLNDLSFQKSMSENESKSERDSSSKSMEEIELGQKEIKNIIVCLQPDVAEIFPNESAVNEALRFLIRITSKNLY